MTSTLRTNTRSGRARDEGTVLIMVLVMSIIGSLIVLPLLAYTNTVIRSGRVQINKSEAVEAAEGGTWVALNNQGALYDLCVGGPLLSSIDDVTTTCEVLATQTLRDASAVPFHSATIEADVQVPAAIATAQSYVNPNTSADPAAWRIAPDSAAQPTAGTVWLPELPVQSISAGGLRDTTMLPGTFDSSWPTCRVFFPGTFTSAIVLDGPTYFASGVYYFTRPIELRSGADVVVGNGAELGCTNDFEAISGASFLPNPLNMSGLGGTFVLGDQARISIDDSGSGDVRFVMNQRYVAAEETSVAASSNVSIISVNGTHAPYVGAEVLGDDLQVPGIISVPASTVGTTGSPLAANSGYLPSRLSAKVGPPGAPTVTSTVSHQRDRSGNSGPADRGRLTVFWDAAADNGSPITGYVATDLVSGLTCSPATPTLPDTSIQRSCTIKGISNQTSGSGITPIVTVTATNAAGSGDASAPFNADRLDLSGSDQVPSAAVPDAPGNLVATNHTDGLSFTWDTPNDNGSPITGYRVTATDPVSGLVHGCDGWWDENGCVILTSAGLVDGVVYDIALVALQSESTPAVEYQSTPTALSGHLFTPSLATTPAPVQTAAPVALVRTSILDFTTTGTSPVTVSVAGYVAVPQGLIEFSATSPATSTVSLLGGVLAGQMFIDPAGAPTLDVQFANPVAQKRIRLVSTSTGLNTAVSEAIVQVNRSGSIAINSWVIQ